MPTAMYPWVGGRPCPEELRGAEQPLCSGSKTAPGAVSRPQFHSRESLVPAPAAPSIAHLYLEQFLLFSVEMAAGGLAVTDTGGGGHCGTGCRALREGTAAQGPWDPPATAPVPLRAGGGRQSFPNRKEAPGTMASGRQAPGARCEPQEGCVGAETPTTANRVLPSAEQRAQSGELGHGVCILHPSATLLSPPRSFWSRSITISPGTSTWRQPKLPPVHSSPFSPVPPTRLPRHAWSCTRRAAIQTSVSG